MQKKITLFGFSRPSCCLSTANQQKLQINKLGSHDLFPFLLLNLVTGLQVSQAQCCPRVAASPKQAYRPNHATSPYLTRNCGSFRYPNPSAECFHLKTTSTLRSYGTSPLMPSLSLPAVEGAMLI